MSLACAMVRLRLPAADDATTDGRLAAHVATCLPCQAEQARYRAMHRWLGDLGATVETAPAGLSASVAASIGRPIAVAAVPAAASTVARTTMAAAAGAAVVAAAVIVGYRRSRAA